MAGRGNEAPSLLWQYVPLDQRTVPELAAQETIRKGLVAFWERLRQRPAPIDPTKAQLAFRGLPPHLVNRAVPPLRWEEAVAALDEALREWLEAETPQAASQVIVGAPGSGTADVLTAFAPEHGFPCIEAPSAEQILSGGDAWLRRWQEIAADVLVLPRLERCYLRHPDGFSLLRRLLEWLWRGEKRYLVGCDSWAWSYFSHAFEVDAYFPPPYTLAAFDERRLRRWFATPAEDANRAAFTFRQADGGSFVLRTAQATGEDPQESAFLKQLAAHCHGLPEIARAVWIHSLQLSDDVDLDPQTQDVAAGDQGLTIWVRSWSDLELPLVPAGVGRSELFILHTLRLHGGLPAEVMTRLLLMPTAKLLRSLHGLRTAGLLEEVDGIWQVTRLGSPAVVERLSEEGFSVG